MVFETMESMTKRLAGTGSGAQAKAVVAAIKLINKAPGMLDEINTAVAIYNLAVALVGKERALSAIENTVHLNSVLEEVEYE